MTRYFIETSVIIEYLRGTKAAVSFLDSLGGEAVSGYICMAELYEGVHRVKNVQEAAEGVESFFAGLDDILFLSQHSANLFGQKRAELKKRGQIIEDIDLMIAALCLEHHCRLVTANARHFKRVAGLDIVDPFAE